MCAPVTAAHVGLQTLKATVNPVRVVRHDAKHQGQGGASVTGIARSAAIWMGSSVGDHRSDTARTASAAQARVLETDGPTHELIDARHADPLHALAVCRHSRKSRS